MIFRDATEADLDALVRLLADDDLGKGREAPGDPAYLAGFRAMQAQGGNRMILAEDAGEIIACLQLTIIPGISRRGATRALIEAVSVAAGRRGEGLGERLMERALDRARAEGCSLAQLTSDLARVEAHRFYARLGFVHSHAGYKKPL